MLVCTPPFLGSFTVAHPTWNSGQKRCLPHLLIPGEMATPQRFYTNKENRRQLNLAVFCNIHGGIFIIETTGSKYDGYEAGTKYLTQAGNDASKMVAGEYMHCVQAALNHFMQYPAFREVRESAMLVHDKSKVHMSKPVKKGLEDLALRVVVGPPRSPDLMPLDYGIFGFTKTQLERNLTKHANWGDRVQKFKELLRTASPVATIEEFPLRLQACINAKGSHLASGLKKLKRARSVN
jgi:hypothetical protein